MKIESRSEIEKQISSILDEKDKVRDSLQDIWTYIQAHMEDYVPKKEQENQIQYFSVSNGNDFPNNPVQGAICIKWNPQRIYVFTENAWKQITDAHFLEKPKSGEYCTHCGAPVDPRYPNCQYCDVYY